MSIMSIRSLPTVLSSPSCGPVGRNRGQYGLDRCRAGWTFHSALSRVRDSGTWRPQYQCAEKVHKLSLHLCSFSDELVFPILTCSNSCKIVFLSLSVIGFPSK